jgi:multiple sugar transport system substrate-binding protein
MAKARRLIIVALALVLVLIPVFTTRVSAQDTVTVKVWMHVHPPRVDLDKQIIAQFEKDNPNIKIDFKWVPANDWDTTLNTGLASGAGPDLFNQATFAIGQFKAQDILAPVDLKAAGYTDLESVYKAYQDGQALLSGALFDGQLYGLPTELSAYACFTNNALWKAAGLDPNKDFPTTWEDLKTVADKLTVRDSSGAITQRGFDFRWKSSIFMLLEFNPMVQQLGGNMIDEKNYTASINTPEVKKVMQYWNDWTNTWKLGGAQYEDDRTDFLAGHLAIDCDFGNWGVPQMVDAKIEYTVHPIPLWKDAKNKNGFANYAYFFMVNKSASPAVQQAAWKFVAAWSNHAKEMFDIAGLYQAKVDFVQSDEFKKNSYMPIFLNELGASTYHPRIAGFFEVSDALLRGRDRIVTGHEDIDKVLAETQTEVTDILTRAKADATKK